MHVQLSQRLPERHLLLEAAGRELARANKQTPDVKPASRPASACIRQVETHTPRLACISYFVCICRWIDPPQLTQAHTAAATTGGEDDWSHGVGHPSRSTNVRSVGACGLRTVQWLGLLLGLGGFLHVQRLHGTVGG